MISHITQQFFLCFYAPRIRILGLTDGTTAMINRMHIAPFAHLSSHTLLWRIFVALALLLCGVSIALAGPREQAARIHDRLAGVPADEATLSSMAATLPGNPTAAANIAMNNPNFYSVTLKNFAAPWTNRDQNAFVPLNDYTALVMGMVWPVRQGFFLVQLAV